MNLAQVIRDATEAIRQLNEALKPRTETEYWQWLRHDDPLRYIAKRRAAEGKRSPRPVAYRQE